jgi:hypothetical protein
MWMLHPDAVHFAALRRWLVSGVDLDQLRPHLSDAGSTVLNTVQRELELHLDALHDAMTLAARQVTARAHAREGRGTAAIKKAKTTAMERATRTRNLQKHIRRLQTESLRRRGPDVEVTLFDPVFSFPLLSSSLRAGVASEVRHAEAVPAGYGTRLVEILASVYGARYAPEDGGGAVATTTGWRYRLEALGPDPTCRFPAAIELSPRFGGPHMRARTVDVACAPAP